MAAYFQSLDGTARQTVPDILDRFLQHAEVLTLTGRSYRLKNPLNGSKSAKAPIGSEAEK